MKVMDKSRSSKMSQAGETRTLLLLLSVRKLVNLTDNAWLYRNQSGDLAIMPVDELEIDEDGVLKPLADAYYIVDDKIRSWDKIPKNRRVEPILDQSTPTGERIYRFFCEETGINVVKM